MLMNVNQELVQSGRWTDLLRSMDKAGTYVVKLRRFGDIRSLRVTATNFNNDPEMRYAFSVNVCAKELTAAVTVGWKNN